MSEGLAAIGKFPGIRVGYYPVEWTRAGIAAEHTAVGVYQASGEEGGNLFTILGINLGFGQMQPFTL